MARERGPVEVAAELVGTVLEVHVAAGERVVGGQPLLLVESMKMEIPVLSDNDGRVGSVLVAPGDVVQRGQVLLTLTPLASAP